MGEASIDLERSAALRKQVDELMEQAAARPAVPYVPSSERRAESAPFVPPMPPRAAAALTSQQLAAAKDGRDALLRQAGEMRRQHEAVDLGRAYADATASSAAAAQRTQREGDIMADRALRKVAALHDNFRNQLIANGVNELHTLDDLGIDAANLEAVRKQGAIGRQNKYLDASDGARRARAHRDNKQQ